MTRMQSLSLRRSMCSGKRMEVNSSSQGAWRGLQGLSTVPAKPAAAEDQGSRSGCQVTEAPPRW